VPRLIDQTRLSEEILERGQQLVVGVAQLHEPEVQQPQRTVRVRQLLEAVSTSIRGSRYALRQAPASEV
jgi:hypothetical protein